jgi:hypothetical protein
VRESAAHGRDVGLTGQVVPIPWRNGSAAFTLSATFRAAFRQEIANQENHHRKLSFREELIHLLERAGVPFDERYLD